MPVSTQKLQEGIKAARGFASADISSNVDSTVFHDVSGFREVAAIASCAALAAAGTLTLTLLQASDAAGTGKKVLGTARVATTDLVATSVLANIVSEAVAAMDHANGFTFVGARVKASAAVAGEVVLMLSGARYNPQSQYVAA